MGVLNFFHAISEKIRMKAPPSTPKKNQPITITIHPTRNCLKFCNSIKSFFKKILQFDPSTRTFKKCFGFRSPFLSMDSEMNPVPHFWRNTGDWVAGNIGIV